MTEIEHDRSEVQDQAETETFVPSLESNLVQVYESIQYFELELAKSVLKGIGIPVFVQGANAMMLTEAVLTGTLWVPEEKAQEALEALGPLKEGVGEAAEEQPAEAEADV